MLIILIGFVVGVESINVKKIILILISFFGASLIVDPDSVMKLLNYFLPFIFSEISKGEDQSTIRGDIFKHPFTPSYCVLEYINWVNLVI